MPSLEEPSVRTIDRLGEPPLSTADAARWESAGDVRALASNGRAGGRTARAVLRCAQVLALAALAYLCLFNLSVVRGSSMAPGIHDGDRILIDHLAYFFHGVGRGDVVVLKYPLDPSVDYIKRVIGLPGDRVEMREGRVWINGGEVEEPYVADVDRTARVELVVKPAHYFVLGDNRPRSCDSREFGLVPQDYVRGRVALRVWPLARAGRIDGEVHAAR